MKIKQISIFFTLVCFRFLALGQQFYSESFESNLGGWTQETTDNFDWTRNSGGTPTTGTGPSSASEGNYYLYIESTGYTNNQTASISRNFNLSSTKNPSISFDFHIYGDDAGFLQVFATYGTTTTTTEEIWNSVTQGVQNKDEWQNAKVPIPKKPNIKLRFRATTQHSDSSDIAIDNIKMVDFDTTEITHTNVTCGAYKDGSITIKIKGGNQLYAYSIDDGENYTQSANTTYTFSNLAGGEYPIKIKDVKSGCIMAPKTVKIFEPATSEIEYTKTDVKPCPDSKNGKITITATGEAPFQYSIGGFGGTFGNNNSFSNLDSGNYELAVKDTHGCITVGKTIKINALGKIFVTELTPTNVSTCNGDCNGALTITTAGGNSPIEYSINGTLYQKSGYFPDLCARDYKIYIRDSEGCKDTTITSTITQPTKVVVNAVNQSNVTGCYGDSTGTITITATGGTGDLKYSINNGINYFPQSTFTELPAKTTYKIKVRDEKFCIAEGAQITITEPDELLIDSIKHKNVEGCFGDANGKIHIYTSGGTGNIQYSLDSGKTLFPTEEFTNLNIGEYYPFIKDQNNCQVQENPITITQPKQLEITNITKTDVEDCFGNATGKIQILAINGVIPYKYSVDTGTTWHNDYIVKNLTVGKYKVAVKDNVGCITHVDTRYIINQPPQIIITEDTILNNVTCHGLKNGTIEVKANGGTGKLRYSINNGASFPYPINTKTVQDAGTYKIKVIDENNCKISGKTLTITEPPQLVIDTVIVKDIENCYGDSTGVIEIQAHGGTSPIKYSIDNGLTRSKNPIFTSLPAQAGYVPYIIDTNNCFAEGSQQTIGQPPALYIYSQDHTNIEDCHGKPAGTITIAAKGGTGNITYSINNGNSFLNNAGKFENLYAGTYNTKIKDENDCEIKGWPEIILQPDTLIIDSIKHKNIVCNGLGNGQIRVYAHGGKPQLKYILNSGIPHTAPLFTHITPGNYQITVKDKFNCTATGNVTLTEPTTLIIDTVEHTDVNTCYGDNTGTITITAHGGVPELKYSYSSLQGINSEIQTSNKFTGLSQGSYYITVKDKNGCIKTSSAFTIKQPKIISLNEPTLQNIKCFGEKNGQITINVTGGVGNYSYSIDNGQNWQKNNTFENLEKNKYTIIAKDSNNCQTTPPISVDILEPQKLEIYDIQKFNPTCFGYEDGMVIVSKSGGRYPFKYTLNDTITQQSEQFRNLAEGSYTVTVTDKNNCSAKSDTVTLKMPKNLALFSADTTFGCAPLTVKFKKDTAAALFKWDFGDNIISPIQNPTHTFENTTGATVNYTVKVVAEYQQCADTASKIITVYNQSKVKFAIDTNVHFYPDTTVKITNINTTLQNYQWDFGDNSNFDGIQPIQHNYSKCGLYTMKLTAENNFKCPDTTTVDILITGIEPQAGFVASEEKGCSPLNVEFTNTTANAQNFEWTILNTNEVFSNDKHTEYKFQEALNYEIQLKAYGYCGKTNSYTKTITTYPHPKVDFKVVNDTVGVMQGVTFDNFTTGETYCIWDFGDGKFSGETTPEPHKYENPGLYDIILKATSANGCFDSLLLKNAVFVSSDFFFTLPTAFSPDDDGINDLFVPAYNMVEKCVIEIYTRRGQIIFLTEDFKNTFWDGKRNGKKLPMDVYLWRAVGNYASGENFVKYGEVTLLRVK